MSENDSQNYIRVAVQTPANTMSNIAAPTEIAAQGQSLLFRVPQEIRNYIYSYVFTVHLFMDGNKQHPNRTLLNLLLACRRAQLEIGSS